MTVEGLSPMTKVEVVVRSADADAVARQIVSAGATGYTSLPGVTGLGHHGAHIGRALFNDQDALTTFSRGMARRGGWPTGQARSSRARRVIHPAAAR
jgi:hypothetical protein